ncbi:MAG: hypothetical protein ACI8PZ_006329 [Myxococcota bacterium]|jgi:hypothetical protein
MLVLALLLSSTPDAAAGAPGPLLQAMGTCPGPMVVGVSGLTPGADLLLVTTRSGPGVDPAVLPAGPCEGLEVGVEGRMRWLGPTPDLDGDGRMRFDPDVPSGACPRWLVAVDMATCTRSVPVPLDGGAPLTVDWLRAGDLTITEAMPDPAAVTDAEGEWFELRNDTPQPVDLAGLVVSDDGIEDFVVEASVVVASGGHAVLGVQGDPELNGGVDVDYVWGSFEMFLANDDDEITLVAPFAEVSRLAWDGGILFPDPTGASMQLTPGGDPAVGADWCESTSPFGLGDLGTPGTSNLVCAD